jgi:hypothetical protein
MSNLTLMIAFIVGGALIMMALGVVQDSLKKWKERRVK